MPALPNREREIAAVTDPLARDAAARSRAVASVGCDVASIERMQRALDRTPHLLERLFAPAERGLSVASLAARFAAKEALVKALGGLESLSLSEIEVRNDAAGRPFFSRSDGLDRALAAAKIGEVHLSMSHDAGVAIAFVVAERATTARASAASGSDDAGTAVERSSS